MIQNRKNWTDEEDKAIIALVKKHGTKNWAEISQKMVSKYGIQTRSGKQCRERWHNHLDPSINKQSWTAKEEKKLFQEHQQNGNKWTEIAKSFEGRTDNDIKNHFYSMLRRSLRRINKILGMRNSTKKIKLIKPSVLSKIFVNIGQQNGQKSNDSKSNCQTQIEISQALFQFSKAKTIGDMSDSLDMNEKKKFEQLIQKLSHFNQEYQVSQLSKKESRKSMNSIEANPQEQVKMRKNISQLSKKSENSKKIKRVLRKKTSAPLNTNDDDMQGEQGQIKLMKNGKKQSLKHQVGNGRGRKKEESSKFKVALEPMKDQDVQEQEKGYMTRLKKNQSQMSLNMGGDFSLDLYDMPQYPGLDRPTSVSDGGKSVKSNNIFGYSPGFGTRANANNYFMSLNSPREVSNWTPLCPSPNLSDMFLRGGNVEWKGNNEELDNILNQTRRKIERQSMRE